jgi:polysaccharide transporter, PST family
MAIDGRRKGDPEKIGLDSSDFRAEFDVSMDMDGLKRASIRGSVATGLAQGVKMISQFASQLVLARLLFPQDFGLVAMIFPVLALVQILGDLGLAQAIIQRPKLTQAQVSSLFWITVTAGTLLGLIVVGIAPIAAGLYSEPRLIAPMRALGATLPIAALGILPVALLTRQMRFGVLSTHDVIATLSGISSSIVSALNGLSYWSLVVGSLVTISVNLLLNWWRCSWRPSFPQLADSSLSDLRFGGGITVSNLSNFITTSGDALIIGLTIGKTALGLFDRSYRLVALPTSQLMAPIGNVATPLLCRLADRPDRYRQTFLELFQALLLLIVPIMLIGTSNAAVLVHWLLGERWEAASPVFAWICVGGLTTGAYQSAVWLFISQGRTGKLAAYLLTAALINLSAFLLGSVGGIVLIAALGSLSFTLLTTPLVLWGATRVGPVSGRDLVTVAVPIALQSSFAYLALRAQSQMGVAGVPQLILATITCYSVFAISALAMPQQRSLFRLFVRRLQSSFRLPAFFTGRY